MDVTEVRVFLRNKDSNKKLKAYATITFDHCFVVRDVKIIEGSKGLFVAMPSSRMKATCQHCGHRNVVRSRFCNQCGAGLESGSKPLPLSDENRQAEHKDIAHPITPDCREYIQRKVLEEYDNEARRAPALTPQSGHEPASADDFSDAENE